MFEPNDDLGDQLAPIDGQCRAPQPSGCHPSLSVNVTNDDGADLVSILMDATRSLRACQRQSFVFSWSGMIEA